MLTPRQLQVLALRASGATHKEIADRLGMSMGTVKVHVTEIKTRLGCVGSNAIRMAQAAREAGIQC